MENALNFDIEKISFLIHVIDPKGFVYDCPSRQWAGFLIVTEGEFFVEAGDEARSLKKGDAVFLRKEDKYSLSCENGVSYYASALDFTEGSAESMAHLSRFAHLSPVQLEKIGEITKAWQRQTRESYMFCKIQLLGLYYDLICSHLVSDSSQSEPVSLAIRYIHKNFKRNFTSRELAEYCSISESYLRTKFSGEVGMTVWEYRDKLRITAAKELLTSGLFTVKQTAYELGFCDVYYFSKFFTKRIGVPPARYIHTSKDQRVPDSVRMVQDE